MALATLENVTASAGEELVSVSLRVEDDGLVVGSFGKLLWAGSQVQTTARPDGCVLHLTAGNGGTTSYFVPSESFASFGGVGAMPTFMQLISLAATRAGAHVVNSGAGA